MGVTYAAQRVVIGQGAANALLACLSVRPAAQLLATGKVRLSKDPLYNPQPGTLLAALTAQEANYSGYTAGGIAVALNGPINLSGNAQGYVQSVLFSAAVGAPFVPNNVTGWWIDDGTLLWYGERFANNLVASFATPGDYLELVVITPEQLFQATF